jgi:hypothetical protein
LGYKKKKTIRIRDGVDAMECIKFQALYEPLSNLSLTLFVSRGLRLPRVALGLRHTFTAGF